MNPDNLPITPAESNPELAQLYLGLGSVAYALAKVDGRIQLAEMQIVKELLAGLPHGELALYAFFLRENCDEGVEEAYDFGMRRFVNNRKILTDLIKKQFVNILIRIAEAHDDTSIKEQAMIKRFRRDLRRL
ncbi:TerB family tellurite resistance protein [Spirosoma utsteinense]|uniref:Tellurite resistance protein B-like protein n=1 Tax=Spirosoma utsteinense TaxID=2585773 RepID=A0ABR6W052_9BACT|nr:TerB family tellurite resistance protein [Spirosoma utsteinense]MBC3784687.1 putative tellurite resistance protein B-like protein [Spirosoma utsteinense]MBC3789559.1 putative tellurite resistance protein B-like protein [Spirosoma utsteinense]